MEQHLVRFLCISLGAIGTPAPARYLLAGLKHVVLSSWD
jgi:hypothetical protein